MDATKITLWFSCARFTIKVVVEDNMGRTILSIAPIARCFIGQPLRNLILWAGRFGNVRYERIDPPLLRLK